MGTDDGPRAWAFLRRNPGYQASWREAFEWPKFEPRPFPVRIQSRADRRALEWGLLAWENPLKIDGPVSPFWAEAPMLEGEWEMGPPPLLGLLVSSGMRIEGLRLADGTLILKLENRTGAAQVRIGPETGVGIDTGLVLRLGLGQAKAIALIKDIESLTRDIAPDARRRRRSTDRELLEVLDGRLAGKSWRETAVDLYGAERVAADWNTESWIRSRVRRRGKKARFLMQGGYRDLVAGR